MRVRQTALLRCRGRRVERDVTDARWRRSVKSKGDADLVRDRESPWPAQRDGDARGRCREARCAAGRRQGDPGA